MDTKKELELTKKVAMLNGKILVDVKFKQEKYKKRDTFIVELIFADRITNPDNPRHTESLVFALDKEITLDEQNKEILEGLIK